MVKYLRVIDPHVHLRWNEYPNHDFMKLGFRDMKKVGVGAVILEPNTTPALTDWTVIAEYLQRAKEHQGSIATFAHISLTNDEQQVKTALHTINAGMQGIRSDKTFYADSTGDTGVKSWDDHAMLWRTKRIEHYTGVSTGHFENENLFVAEYRPELPLTHNWRRPGVSEVTQVEAQLRLAYDNRFGGTFYVNHVSSPDTVHLVENVRKSMARWGKHSFPIALEITWHHMFLNHDHIFALGPLGNLLKMNPPLRSPEEQQALLGMVLAGRFDCIGSDHAPHPFETKSGKNPKSGIPALPFIPRGIELLRQVGIKDETLDSLIFRNANTLFNLEIEPEIVDTEYDPSLWEAYGWNPFSAVDGTR